MANHGVSQTHHLLIVEDDELVQSLLAAYLQSEGYRVSIAATGAEMQGILDAESVDLILLDLTLPDEDGIALARKVRTRSNVPIIVLTARTARSDRMASLEIGVDDYLTKPFDPEELMLRVRNTLQRAAGGGSGSGPGDFRPDNIAFEGWILNLDGRTLTTPEGKSVDLSRGEFNLLAALAKAPNRVLTRDYLLDAVSGINGEASQRMIDVMVSRLRKKIERDPRKPERITTITGCGYKFASTLG